MPDMDTATIEANIAKRKAIIADVEELVELGENMCVEGQHDPRSFWLAIAAMAEDRAGIAHEPIPEVKPKPAKTMTDDEAKRFGRKAMTFGKFKNQPINDVDIDYLEWADFEMGQWWRDLHDYLGSGYVQRET